MVVMVEMQRDSASSESLSGLPVQMAGVLEREACRTCQTSVVLLVAMKGERKGRGGGRGRKEW